MSNGGGAHGQNVHNESVRRMNEKLREEFGRRETERRMAYTPAPTPAPSRKRRELVVALALLALAVLVGVALLRGM